MFRLRHPDVITEGMVFIGKNCSLTARPGYGRLVIGRWVHFGPGNLLYAHEGQLRVGDKTVFGRNNTVQSYLDVEIGGSCIIADWVYVCDFDHRIDDITMNIKDQGLNKSPVRIGPDVWVGAKVTVLRGTFVGHGSVLAAHAVVRGEVEPFSVMGGVPARVLKNRKQQWDADEQRRIDLADIARKTAVAAEAVQRA